jgi:uncharacterized protein (DUF433 family)
METIQSINLIVKNPDIRGGTPCVGGTSLRVSDIVMVHLFHKRTPDQIASDYEITLAQVYAALAYYYEHKSELDEDVRQQILRSRSAKESPPNGKSSLLS